MKSRWISYKMHSFFPPSHTLFFTSIKTLSTLPNLTSNFNLTSSFILTHVNISRLLSKYGRDGNLQLGTSLHASIIKTHHFYDPTNRLDPRTCIVVWNSLLGMYAKCRALRDARKVFDEMPLRDTVSWNSIVSGFLRYGEFGVGFGYFKELVGLGVAQFDQASFTTVISACDRAGFLSVCQMVHGLVILSGYDSEVTVGNALVTSYFKCGSSDFAKRIFDEMGERSVVTWTAMVSGLVQNGFYEVSLKVFQGMRGAFVDPNALTYSSLLSACSGLQALQEGRQLHGLLWKLGSHSDFCIESALMDMYSKCGSMSDALQIFNFADKLDEVSMTILLVGFAQNGFEEDAIQIFLKMVRSGAEIDPNVVSAILGVFGADTSLAFGQQIHSLVIKKRYASNPFVSNGLINMYAKCGNLEESTKVFSRMPHRNSVSWNSVIAAFARHGDGLKAIQLYEDMLSEGVEPTDVTFISLLHACSHVGLVDKGMEFFESMTKVHHINPRMEHYACVVDMLGRAGLLEEAKKFIDELHVKPGVLVWQPLLGGCALHADSELGKIAAESLLLLEPDNPAPYIQLANIFSSEGKWRDRAKTIKRMKEMRLSKETGVSWIEVEKKVHRFIVCDLMHPQTEAIYSVLTELYLQLADEGYKSADKGFIMYCAAQHQLEEQGQDQAPVSSSILSIREPDQTPVSLISIVN